MKQNECLRCRTGVLPWGVVSLLLFSILLATSCTGLNFFGRNDGAASSEPTPTEKAEHLQQQVERYYESIGSRDSLIAAYQTLRVLDEYPVNRYWYNGLLSELSFYCATYAELSADSSSQMYLQGRNSAYANILGADPVLDRFIQGGEGLQAAVFLDSTVRIPVNAVYWWTLNSLLWLNNEPPITRIANRGRIERAIELIEHAAPDYRYGAVHRLRGLLLTISPDGDISRARASFQRAVTESGAFLENRFLYGRYFGVLIQDRDLFRDQMEIILESSYSYPLEFLQLNMLVKKQARWFMKKESVFFAARFN